jgi:hypothetical protein
MSAIILLRERIGHPARTIFCDEIDLCNAARQWNPLFSGLCCPIATDWILADGAETAAPVSSTGAALKRGSEIYINLPDAALGSTMV